MTRQNFFFLTRQNCELRIKGQLANKSIIRGTKFPSNGSMHIPHTSSINKQIISTCYNYNTVTSIKIYIKSTLTLSCLTWHEASEVHCANHWHPLAVPAGHLCMLLYQVLCVYHLCGLCANKSFKSKTLIST